MTQPKIGEVSLVRVLCTWPPVMPGLMSNRVGGFFPEFNRFLAIFLMGCLIAIGGNSSFAQASNNSQTDEELKAKFRASNESLSSYELGERFMMLIDRNSKRIPPSNSLFDLVDRNFSIETDAILGIFGERMKSGDREAHFNIARYAYMMCATTLKQGIASLADAYCKTADKELQAVIGFGDARAMGIIALMYERGIYYQRSAYAAADWYVRLIRMAISANLKDAAYSLLEKINSLESRHPDLIELRRQVSQMK